MTATSHRGYVRDFKRFNGGTPYKKNDKDCPNIIKYIFENSIGTMGNLHDQNDYRDFDFVRPVLYNKN